MEAVKYQTDYERIAKVIDYIQSNFQSQPTLEELADLVHLSPFHFQRLFKSWAGVSPKKFIQYTSLNYAKALLRGPEATLFNTALQTGLSGTSRLHDLFVSIERMTPGEFKNGGENLKIEYSVQTSPFSYTLIASTSKGICHVSFIDSEEQGVDHLKSLFPNASIIENELPEHLKVSDYFNLNASSPTRLKVHLNGTDFQLKVWEALLTIPFGTVSTYGNIAHEISNPDASRAVGTAIGSNPVAFIIPCHRVIQSSGKIGGYLWGPTRKSAILGWEASKSNVSSDVN